MSESNSPLPMPKHVAVIMDGNGRWAKERGLARTDGHREGAKTVRKIVTRAREVGIGYLTLYAFSSQNWSRPRAEVRELMGLLVEFCHKERKLLLDKGIRFRVIGERDRMPLAARKAAEVLEKATKSNTSMQLVIALSYGGREEIVEAAKTLARRVKSGVLDPESIDEGMISANLWTSDMPDPDLIIRTSGELRLSNFLLWQAAYTELYVDECYWPDFDEAAFDKAMHIYRSRERRYGGVTPK
ncbi:MAG: undecaprenyl diphosphate synthase [Bradymonadia bacterium]|jgi:undecaprenyl diphosphate synthase